MRRLCWVLPRWAASNYCRSFKPTSGEFNVTIAAPIWEATNQAIHNMLPGNFPVYTVNATGGKHVAAGFDSARVNNNQRGINNPGLYLGYRRARSSTGTSQDRGNNETKIKGLFRPTTPTELSVSELVNFWLDNSGYYEGIAQMKKQLTDKLSHKDTAPARPWAGPWQADWRNDGFGEDSYGFLLSAKQKYDPDSVFWYWRCVGNDAWAEAWAQETGGALYRLSTETGLPCGRDKIRPDRDRSTAAVILLLVSENLRSLNPFLCCLGATVLSFYRAGDFDPLGRKGGRKVRSLKQQGSPPSIPVSGPHPG
ncbi:hypothetical protein CCM_08553 [Cordyceps militaris CM01]|uniref:Uncharacterized protein n=1 Tax=Cordyceps militaris (strain CM01) TaxID=983644 RepID=G3JRF9_CORMM|nr:uncharacterized protein CCM_08553 [Cordyceps militaris CM01]EGX88509.1 hypothetical protein CCM_08553 [Cordyceps militaris CM01]